jgi:predicted Zn finger-like uncharacterized protein
MAIATNCPSCDAKFNLSDELEGKTVKCKRCQSSFVVPSANAIAAKPSAKSSSRPGADDDDDDKDRSSPPPLKKSRRERDDDDDDRDRDDDDDDRPRRRRKRESDSDDRPVKKKKKKKGGVSMLAIGLIGGGVLLLMCAGCAVGGIAFAMKSNDPKGVLGGGAANKVVFGADGVFRAENKLSRFDRVKDHRRYRSYEATFEAGKTYTIEMNSDQFDAYLYILDDTGLTVAQDDDSGGNLNARIVFTPRRGGVHQIECTSFADFETGSFALIVRRH